MTKILSDEMYKQVGKEIDEKLEPMQKIIFEQARRKAMEELNEFEEGRPDSIEDLEAARKAIQGELVKFNVTPLFIHYPLIIRALHELIIIRKHLEKKRKDES